MYHVLSEAIAGFLLARQVEGCSPNTIRNYNLDLRRFCVHVGHRTPLTEITADHIRSFLATLQTTRLAPAGVAPRPAATPSPKTITNAHTTLRSFFHWAVDEGYLDTNPAAEVTPPRPSAPAVTPLTREEVHALLRATERTNPYRNRPTVRNRRPDALQRRDRAIILILLDTGIRASELCNLTISDYNPRTGHLTVRGKSRHASGQGRQRVVYLSSATRRVLAAYLSRRDAPPDAPLLANADGSSIERRHLAHHLRRLGERAGVRDVHPHRFRHTFAITYLRNGGDSYTLQQLLGHSSLDMVRRYLAIAQTDCAAAHRRCSPVAHWF